MPLTRREFVSSSLVGMAGISSSTVGRVLFADNTQTAIPIVDTHTHFYDPTRPEGIPWPSKDNALLYRTVLPKEFKELTKPFGVTGTVIVEASSWVEDNQWLLDLAAKDPFVLGVVGHLTPGPEPFALNLARFAKNPIFRGIRVGAGAVQQGLQNPIYLGDLRRMIDLDLELDMNGGPEMLMIASQLAERLPQLRIVVNHLSNIKIDGKEPPADWLVGLRTAAKHQNVFLKVSALVESARTDGHKAPDDTAFYRPILQAAWNSFGEDRLIFGSNWPVSDIGGPYQLIVKIVTEYFRDHGAEAMKKFFAGNAQAAYRWKPRT